MAVPITRTEFIQNCLRRLGAPVIEINVDPDQVEDRIDEALRYYYDYHFDGSEKMYLKYQVSQTDIDNGYLTIPENIMGVVNIFDIGNTLISSGMFSVQYQIALNDLYTLTSQSVIPYYMAYQHLAFLQEILVGKKPIRYNRHVNKLYIDTAWNQMIVGSWIIVEAYQIVDPEFFVDVWGDRWLQKYATAKIGEQWATNLTKFTGMQLPGGVQYNGEAMLSRYQKEIDDLEHEMVFTYSLPVSDMIG